MQKGSGEWGEERQRDRETERQREGEKERRREGKTLVSPSLYLSLSPSLCPSVSLFSLRPLASSGDQFLGLILRDDEGEFD